MSASLKDVQFSPCFYSKQKSYSVDSKTLSLSDNQFVIFLTVYTKWLLSIGFLSKWIPGHVRISLLHDEDVDVACSTC